MDWDFYVKELDKLRVDAYCIQYGIEENLKDDKKACLVACALYYVSDMLQDMIDIINEQ